MRRALAGAAVIPLGLTMLAGCGGDEPKSAGGPSTVQVERTVTKEVTPAAPTTSEPGTAAEEAETSDPEDEVDPEASDSTGPSVLKDTGADRTLTLADTFSADQWEEGSYKAAGSTKSVQGIRTSVSCYSDGTEPIELRFADAKGKLKVAVAQDVTSEASDNVLAFDLIVDGRKVRSKNVAFSKTNTLSTDLSGVVVVKIVASRVKSDDCEGSALALITKLEITAT